MVVFFLGEHSDPWSWGWEALVALATIVLGLVTAALAYFTWSVASRTSQLAKEAAADQRAQWRPVILPTGPSMSGRHGVPVHVLESRSVNFYAAERTLVARIRNGGRGPAFYVQASLNLRGSETHLPEGGVVGCLEPGDEYDLVFPLFRLAPASLRLLYEDLAGRTHTSSITIVVTGGYPKVWNVAVQEVEPATGWLRES